MKGACHIRRVPVFCDDGLDRPLVDGLRVGRIEFLVARILVVSQYERDLAALARREFSFHLVRANGSPAVGNRIREAAALDGYRLIPASIGSHERVTLGVKRLHLGGARKIGKVIASLAIFRLVINNAVFDFHLPDAKVALEIRGVVLRVPQAKLNAGEY